MAKITGSGGAQTPSNRAQGNNLGQSNNAQAQQSQSQNSNQAQNANADNLLLTRGEEEHARGTPETGDEWFNRPKYGGKKPKKKKKKSELSVHDKIQMAFRYLWPVVLGSIIAISAYISDKAEFNGERISNPKTDREKVDEINENFRKAQEKKYQDSIDNASATSSIDQDDKFQFQYEIDDAQGNKQDVLVSSYAEGSDFVINKLEIQDKAPVVGLSKPSPQSTLTFSA